MNDQKHEIHYQISPCEVRRLMFRTMVLRPRYVFVWLAVCAFGAWQFGTEGSGSFFFILVAASLVGASYTVFRAVRSQSWRTEPRTVTFDSVGIGSTGASGSSCFPWSAFSRFSHDKRYFYLHAPDGAVCWLPRSAFTQTQADALQHHATDRNA